MPDLQIVQAVTSISSVLGLLGLLAYLYFLQQQRSAVRSVREVVGGNRPYLSVQIVEILQTFDTDAARIEALKLVTHSETADAEQLLEKVKANVDVEKLSRLSSKHYLKAAGTTGFAFALIGAGGLAYYYIPGLNGRDVASRPMQKCTEKNRCVDIQRVADFSGAKCDAATAVDKLVITDTIQEVPFSGNEEGVDYVATARRDVSRDEDVKVYGMFGTNFEEVQPVRQTAESADSLEFKIPVTRDGKAVVRYEWSNVNRNDPAHQGVVFTSRQSIRNLGLTVVMPAGSDIKKSSVEITPPSNAGGACSKSTMTCQDLYVSGDVDVNWQWTKWPWEGCTPSAK